MPYISKRRIAPPSNNKEASTRHNNRWGKYYHNKQWKLLREWQITNHPICYDCAINGRSVPAEEVHHVIPFSTGATEQEKLQLLLDPDNLIALCKSCHMKRHGYLKHKN